MTYIETQRSIHALQVLGRGRFTERQCSLLPLSLPYLFGIRLLPFVFHAFDTGMCKAMKSTWPGKGRRQSYMLSPREFEPPHSNYGRIMNDDKGVKRQKRPVASDDAVPHGLEAR